MKKYVLIIVLISWGPLFAMEAFKHVNKRKDIKPLPRVITEKGMIKKPLNIVELRFCEEEDVGQREQKIEDMLKHLTQLMENNENANEHFKKSVNRSYNKFVNRSNVTNSRDMLEVDLGLLKIVLDSLFDEEIKVIDDIQKLSRFLEANYKIIQ